MKQTWPGNRRAYPYRGNATWRDATRREVGEYKEGLDPRAARDFSLGAMNRIRTLVGGGILVWAVPFAVSMFFYDQSGELMIDVFLFKSIMIVLSVSFGGWLLLQSLGRMPSPTGRAGLILGTAWMVLNWGLDAALLLPLTGMALGSYAAAIGLRYLAMPVQGALLGAALQRRP